jgi:cullin 2
MSEAELVYGNMSSDSQEQMEIGELGLDIWRVYMIEYLGDELVKQILEGIKLDRNGNEFNSRNTEVIHGVIQSFVLVQDYKKKGSLKLYQDLFETPMLAASGEYYKTEASKLLQVSFIHF